MCKRAALKSYVEMLLWSNEVSFNNLVRFEKKTYNEILSMEKCLKFKLISKHPRIIPQGTLLISMNQCNIADGWLLIFEDTLVDT